MGCCDVVSCRVRRYDPLGLGSPLLGGKNVVGRFCALGDITRESSGKAGLL
jgi:hypothetical protein